MQGKKLPKYGKWQVTFIVAKCFPRDVDQGDPNDFIVINIGAAMHALEEVGKVYNERPPRKLEIRWPIVHEFLGDSLAFKFAFFTSHNIGTKHLMVLNGKFEEVATPKIKWLKPLLPSGKVQPVAVSDFVEKSRMERKNPASRYVRLLERQTKLQLCRRRMRKIAAPGATLGLIKDFDTDVIHGSSQRYLLDDIMDKLRYEIQVEEARMDYEREAQGKNAKRFMSADPADLSKEELLNRKIWKAKQRYIDRKQGQDQTT